MRQIDTFDAKLLTLLQQSNRLTMDELSQRVGLSASACQRRLSTGTSHYSQAKNHCKSDAHVPILLGPFESC